MNSEHEFSQQACGWKAESAQMQAQADSLADRANAGRRLPWADADSQLCINISFAAAS